MNLLKYFLITLFILAIIPLTSAQDTLSIDNLFIESLTDSQEISPCETVIYEFKLQNTGQELDTFDFGVDPFFENAKLTKASVTLNPGQSKNIKLYITPPCSTHGEYEISFLARSRTSNALFEQKTNLNIIPNDVLKIASDKTKLQYSLEPSFVEIKLENIGPRDSTYFLSLETEETIFKIKPKSITIPANSKEIVKIFFLPDETTQEGKHLITFVAKVDSSGIEYTKTFKAVINEPGAGTAVLTVLTTASSFLLRHWWKFLIALVFLIISIPCFALFLIWHSATKELRKERKAQKKQEKYKEKAEISREKELEQIEKEKENYPLIKKKAEAVLKRELKKEFKLISKTPQFPFFRLLLVFLVVVIGYLTYYLHHVLWYFKAYVVAGIIALLFIILLFFIIKAVQSSRIRSKLYLEDIDKIKEKIKRELSQDYELVPKELYKEFFPSRFNAGSTALFFFSKSKANKLTLKLDWVKGLCEIVIKLASKKPQSILSAQKFKSFPEEPDADVYQYFEIHSHNIDAKETTFSFAVQNSWLKNRNKVKLMRYTEKWVCVPTVKVKEDDQYTYFEAKPSSLDHVYVIVGKTREKREEREKEEEIKQEPVIKIEEKKDFKEVKQEPKLKISTDIEPELLQTEKPKKSKIFFIAVTILLLISVISISFYSMKMEQTQEDIPQALDIDQVEDVTNKVADLPSDHTDGIPPQTWIENTEHKLNLAKYFQDPDGDALTYSALEIEHISTRFEGSTAILIPDFNWYGAASIIFIATDTNNASVNSNPVQLVVTEAPEKIQLKNFFTSFKPYLKYFIMGVIMVIAVLALFEVKKD